METIWEETSSALWLTSEQMKHYYDKHQADTRDYQIGDLILLEESNLTTIRPSKKLDHKCFGPFPIISKISAAAYKLKLPHTWKTVWLVFNEVLLIPYTPTIGIPAETTTSSPGPHWPRTRIWSRRNHRLKISSRKTQMPCPMERLWLTWMNMGTPK